MVIGAITTKHILRHPIMIIHYFGFMHYMTLLLMCMSSTPHHFIDIMK